MNFVEGSILFCYDLVQIKKLFLIADYFCGATMKVLSESESCPSRPRFAVWCHMFPNQIAPSHFCKRNCPRFSLKTMSVLSDKRAFSCRGTMCRALKEMETRYTSFIFTWRTEFIKQVFPMFRRPLAPPAI